MVIFSVPTMVGGLELGVAVVVVLMVGILVGAERAIVCRMSMGYFFHFRRYLRGENSSISHPGQNVPWCEIHQSSVFGRGGSFEGF